MNRPALLHEEQVKLDVAFSRFTVILEYFSVEERYKTVYAPIVAPADTAFQQFLSVEFIVLQYLIQAEQFKDLIL